MATKMADNGSVLIDLYQAGNKFNVPPDAEMPGYNKVRGTIETTQDALRLKG